MDETVKHFGQLDILVTFLHPPLPFSPLPSSTLTLRFQVNNAGILNTGGVTTGTMQAYDDLMNVNVRSVIELCQLAVPHLIKTKGSIVNLSSIAGPCSVSPYTEWVY